MKVNVDEAFSQVIGCASVGIVIQGSASSMAMYVLRRLFFYGLNVHRRLKI